MSYIRSVLIAFDQLVNALTGGNPDCTISACAYVHGLNSAFWRTLERIINYTFEPVDGIEHCLQAYHADSSEIYHDGGYVRKFFIGLCVLLFCIPAIPTIKLIGAFKNA